MSINEQTADRVYKILSQEKGELIEKKMFGGLCFMLDGHMVCGVQKDSILLRVKPETGEKLIERPGIKPMVHRGREMNGFLFAAESEYESEGALAALVQTCLDFVHTLPPKK